MDYDAAAKCPRWLKFLARCSNHIPISLRFLQRAVGYSLTADTRESSSLWGARRLIARNLFETTSAASGDYAGTADFSAFLVRRNNDGPRDDVANMRGRRMIRAENQAPGHGSPRAW